MPADKDYAEFMQRLTALIKDAAALDLYVEVKVAGSARDKLRDAHKAVKGEGR